MGGGHSQMWGWTWLPPRPWPLILGMPPPPGLYPTQNNSHPNPFLAAVTWFFWTELRFFCKHEPINPKPINLVVFPNISQFPSVMCVSNLSILLSWCHTNHMFLDLFLEKTWKPHGHDNYTNLVLCPTPAIDIILAKTQELCGVRFCSFSYQKITNEEGDNSDADCEVTVCCKGPDSSHKGCDTTANYAAWE